MARKADLDTDLKGRVGVSLVETFFLEHGLIFRRQPESDKGVDATVEIHEKGEIKLIALQIKTGKSYFEKHGSDYIYRGSHKHYSYWTGYPIPVFLVLVDPETRLMIFQRVEEHLCTWTKAGFTLIIPSANKLDDHSVSIFSNVRPTDEESRLRQAFAADEYLMCDIAENTVFFKWEEWINKHVNFRRLDIYFDDHHGEPYDTAEFRYRSPDIYEAMNDIFPWAMFTMISQEDKCGEIIEHLMEVSLRPEAKAYLESEQFFKSASAFSWRVPMPAYSGETGNDDDDGDEEEEEDMAWERTVRGDD
ncbi:DUF4365 domain-containing protein [Pararhizobium sp. O133]|uniref:DUF4365 domain-containing protein n=1 Tax=Pararhizobium sp. O133 TaxID=3449278 RepID=UPI003F6859EB